ncbi:hypothetical protein A2V56_04795 [Candidatus Woesebacteria bacterium RBG_19FT_COMBO_42_9]|uniref:DUF5680 domain-containing protein n=1 Tax=Candidatus Woesebacteria bacterium RBG_16_42_24 TaxID=1802485 RepID=A0A1F7XLK4_9BACT|nr:MAG: hypothetical protein A2V97_04030 [Candidatus Woesebacteria bacterium RBG_16_42_24]OGM17716.1 MAG: hypothetical protein A2V56_04795 [Candidatus Woesebacteria bacterium RBG_19FT_COMBO_42_9]OGM66542.1 MAG: hypothetical protein A2985_03055 [Candidatus Woesebacteria bacterium RIFCSPLOWO2_01_FULL_43_11]
MGSVNKKKLVTFLTGARANTYAAGKGKVKPVFPGSTQLEYKEGDWLYRDIYNLGNKIFVGLETVYFKGKPVWSMCYYGDFKKMTEKEIDEILREALIKYKDKVRLWYQVEWKNKNFKYICTPDSREGIEEVSGLEEIYKDREKVYYLYYAGGLIG